MRERMLVDIRRKHMFLWLLEFQWLVFYEHAAESCTMRTRERLSDPQLLTPTKEKCQQEVQAREFFSLSTLDKTDSELWKKLWPRSILTEDMFQVYLLLACELQSNCRLRFGGWLAFKVSSEQVIITQSLRRGLNESHCCLLMKKGVH